MQPVFDYNDDYSTDYRALFAQTLVESKKSEFYEGSSRISGRQANDCTRPSYNFRAA